MCSGLSFTQESNKKMVCSPFAAIKKAISEVRLTYSGL